jgi:flavodoxin
MFEVVYFSRSGNTRKVAEAIADELGVTAKNIKTAGPLSPDAFVFLGTGLYGAVLPSDIARFMNRNKFNGRKIALFTTSAFQAASERALLEKQLKDKGANIVEYFGSFGQWMTMKKNHPDASELENAKAFACGVAVRQSLRMPEKEKTGAAAR